MRYNFTLISLILFCPVAAMSQEKPTVDVLPGRREIEIKLTSGKPLPARFVRLRAKDLTNFSLHEIEPPSEPGTVIKDRTGILDKSAAPECLGFDCGRMKLSLSEPLAVSQTYILAIKGFLDSGDSVTARFTINATETDPTTAAILKGPDVFHQQSQLTLRSKVPVEVKPTIEVHRLYYKMKSDNSNYDKASETIRATVDKKTDKHFVLNLQGRLTEGQDLNLFITDGITIKGTPGQSLRAEGKIKLSGIPNKPEEIRLDANLAGVASTRRKAFFDLTAKYIPTRIYQIGNTEWIWEPTLSVDVGLRSTKSANSIILAPLNFINYFGENLPAFQAGGRSGPAPTLQSDRKHRDRTKVPIYADWMSTPWYRPSDVKFTVGPKAEFDRNFSRKNILGGLRFDFDFHRWRTSISDKRRVLELDFGEDVSKAMRLDYGFSMVPYVSFDMGGHVNTETVTNVKKKASVVVPRHGIFRSYVGFVTTFESSRFRLPLTFTIDEALIHLAAPETIGYVTDEGVGIRRLRGIHHRGKATLSFAFDSSKHYSLSLSYENGRLAPNFEYLNKVSGGFRVVFW